MELLELENRKININFLTQLNTKINRLMQETSNTLSSTNTNLNKISNNFNEYLLKNNQE